MKTTVAQFVFFVCGEIDARLVASLGS